MPPAPPKCHPPRTASDVERMSEKYWGEILERTLSSTSLHALQQSFSGQQSRSRTPLAHHSNRFHHSPSLLTNQTSVLSLNHISRDSGYDPFRSNIHQHHFNHRHTYMGNGEDRLESNDNGNDGSDDDEEAEEDEQDNEDMEEMETSNSDSVQEDRTNGPRVSFISNSNDFSIHDKNCAKAKALNAQIQSVKGLPGI